MKILVCDELTPGGVQAIRAIDGAQVEVKTGNSESQLVQLIKGFDAVVVRSATQITKSVIESGSNLKVIARAGMGYDNIDVQAATENGVVVMNTPAANSVAAAELAVAMMMALARKIVPAHSTLSTGKWNRKQFLGVELTGKTLGLLGLGNVGKNVAKRALGMEMNVLAHDPFVPEKVAKEIGVNLVSQDELFKKIDFLSIHTVLNDSTHHLINKHALKKMKPGACIINCARGGVLDEKALYEALESGKVKGAALDVFEQEPPDPKNPLLTHPNVIVTPHLGASTLEAQNEVGVAVADQLKAFFHDDIVLNGINVPAVSREVLAALGGYIELAEKLGSFLGQQVKSAAVEFSVECAGEIIKYDTKPVGVAALRGFIQHFSSQPVNFVNAPHLAKDRGIRFVHSQVDDAFNYMSLITVRVSLGKEKKEVSGSIFGKNSQRMVRFNEFYVEVEPTGHLLVIHNEDKPGVLGNWATLLGKNKINISQMHLSLKKGKKPALAIVNIDSPAPVSVLEEFRGLESVQSVDQVHL